MSGSAGRLTLDDAVRSLASHRPLLVASDFDGTLSPIVMKPETARPDPLAIQALGELSSRDGVKVAIISGRAHADLLRVVGPIDGVTLVGEHGNDWGDEAEHSPELRTLLAELNDAAGTVAGSVVEVKRNSVALHYRAANPIEVPEILRRVKEVAGNHGVSVMEGKMVIELSFAKGTKADAVATLRESSTRVVYIGDDVTDEEVFKSLGTHDVGIKVGAGETTAGYRVADVEAVTRLLRLLAEEVESLGSAE